MQLIANVKGCGYNRWLRFIVKRRRGWCNILFSWLGEWFWDWILITLTFLPLTVGFAWYRKNNCCLPVVFWCRALCIVFWLLLTLLMISTTRNYNFIFLTVTIFWSLFRQNAKILQWFLLMFIRIKTYGLNRIKYTK